MFDHFCAQKQACIACFSVYIWCLRLKRGGYFQSKYRCFLCSSADRDSFKMHLAPSATLVFTSGVFSHRAALARLVAATGASCLVSLGTSLGLHPLWCQELARKLGENLRLPWFGNLIWFINCFSMFIYLLYIPFFNGHKLGVGQMNTWRGSCCSPHRWLFAPHAWASQEAQANIWIIWPCARWVLELSISEK